MASDNPPVVRTRFLVISDTHGFRYLPDTKPVEPIDVVIHCGDITGSSQLAEFQAAIELLHQIPAPLKLIIPGNHDFTLDEPTYRHLLHKSRKRRSFPDILRSHGQPGDARRLFDEAAKHNTSESTVLYLDEGTHHIPLPTKKTHLTLYASPYTPSFGTPGFQYTATESHHFAIPPDTDIVITHGPPKGVRDISWATAEDGGHVGSAELWGAVEKARPRACFFGHVHEGWGAEVVRWGGGGVVAADGDVKGSSRGGGGNGGQQQQQHHSSAVLADLGSLLPLKGDSAEVVGQKNARLGEYQRGKCIMTSHCVGDTLPVEKGVDTLFVNAAVTGEPVRPAWVVDIELPVGRRGAVGDYKEL